MGAAAATALKASAVGGKGSLTYDDFRCAVGEYFRSETTTTTSMTTPTTAIPKDEVLLQLYKSLDKDRSGAVTLAELEAAIEDGQLSMQMLGRASASSSIPVPASQKEESTCNRSPKSEHGKGVPNLPIFGLTSLSHCFFVLLFNGAHGYFKRVLL